MNLDLQVVAFVMTRSSFWEGPDTELLINMRLWRMVKETLFLTDQDNLGLRLTIIAGLTMPALLQSFSAIDPLHA